MISNVNYHLYRLPSIRILRLSHEKQLGLWIKNKSYSLELGSIQSPGHREYTCKMVFFLSNQKKLEPDDHVDVLNTVNKE